MHGGRGPPESLVQLEHDPSYLWGAGGLPDEHLKIMVRKILSDNVLNELKKQNIDVVIKEYNWVMSDLGRFNDSRLSKWNMSTCAATQAPTCIFC